MLLLGESYSILVLDHFSKVHSRESRSMRLLFVSYILLKNVSY